MAFRWQGSHMDDAAAVRLYIRDRIPSASLTLYRGQASAASDGSLVGWLDDWCSSVFKDVDRNVAVLNDLVDGRRPADFALSPSVSLPPTGQRATTEPSPPHVTGSLQTGRPPTSAQPLHTSQPEGGAPSTSTRPQLVSVQQLPKDLTTVDQVLAAWYSGVDGLLPMKAFVGNKHPTIKLDRRERKQLSDHRCIVRKLQIIDRDEFREQYETDEKGVTRSLRAIRVTLQKEGSGRPQGIK